MAMSDCCRQMIWIQNLLSEINIRIEKIPIYGDNMGSIFNSSNATSEKRTKHIDIRYHYIRECIEDGKVEAIYKPGAKNPADMLTKNLGHVKFNQFRQELGLEFYSP